jgi:hypothetical protein
VGNAIGRAGGGRTIAPTGDGCCRYPRRYGDGDQLKAGGTTHWRRIIDGKIFGAPVMSKRAGLHSGRYGLVPRHLSTERSGLPPCRKMIGGGDQRRPEEMARRSPDRRGGLTTARHRADPAKSRHCAGLRDPVGDPRRLRTPRRAVMPCINAACHPGHPRDAKTQRSGIG